MSYSSEVLADNPLLYLQFGETSGTACANSGSLGGSATTTGTITRNTASLSAFTPGVTLGGTSSDGVTYPDTPAFDLFSGSTYEAWFACSSFGTPQTLISKGQGGIGFYINTTRNLYCECPAVNGLATSTGTIPNDSNWHHLVLTISTAATQKFTFYIDGVAAGATTNLFGTSGTAFALQVGRDVLTGPSYRWPALGKIDEPAVYGAELSAARILAHYNAGIASAPTADFTGTPLSGTAPYTVTFTDASTNTPTSWAWTFGDGGTSTSQNPTHSYTVAGTYTVVLVATNATGSDTKTRTGYVTVLSGFVPQIIWFTPAPATTPAAPTFESATAYSTVANRPAVTGTTRPFASSAALTGALNAASPGDLVLYTGAGILDIPGNFTGFTARRYTGYVNVDLGLKSSPNHVRFTGGTAGYPSVYIYNSQFLRIYGGEITNATGGTEGLQINGAGVPGNGSTNHIVWWNLVVHDCRSDGIGMFPTLALSGSNPTSADLTIADCDIQAEVYNVCLDKTIDVEAELGTGQHCAILADTDPIGATYPSFLRNRVAIDGHDTGLTANQGGGSVIEIGFVDPASTISGCTLIMRGNHMMFNGQRMSGGNCLSVWGDATINAQVPFLQHQNSTGSGVYNNDGVNRSGVVVAYGRHQNTNQNFGLEGTNPWQIGPTYRDVD